MPPITGPHTIVDPVGPVQPVGPVFATAPSLPVGPVGPRSSAHGAHNAFMHSYRIPLQASIMKFAWSHVNAVAATHPVFT